MRNCREVSRLLSESMERKLSRWEHMGLWFHLAMCRLCRGYSSDLQFLRDMARQHARAVETDTAVSDAALSPAARERMKRFLEGRSS